MMKDLSERVDRGKASYDDGDVWVESNKLQMRFPALMNRECGISATCC
jgi:hypothetical protein